MNEGSFTLSLWVLSILAGFFMYLFVKNLLQPEEVKETISDIEVRQIKSTSSFARLRPQENIRDRLA